MAVELLNIDFVQEVEKYPCLYNYTLPEYTRKNTADKAWAAIGDKFKLSGSECKERWKNLRSVFVRHLKMPKIGSSLPKKPYYLADYMQFAIPFIKVLNLKEASQDTTVNNDEDVSLISQTSDDQNASHPSPNSGSHSQPSTSLVLQSQTTRYPLPEFVPSVSEPEYQPLIKKKAIQRENYEEARAENKTLFNIKQAENQQLSNKMFLLSFLSDVNKMDDKQRRAFKRRMLDLVDEILDQDNNMLNTQVPLQIQNNENVYTEVWKTETDDS